MNILFYVIIYITREIMRNIYIYANRDETCFKRAKAIYNSKYTISIKWKKEFEVYRFRVDRVKFIDYKRRFNRRIGGMLENS